MMSVFADTSYFIALCSPRDIGHYRAVRWTANFTGRIITTAWVLAELGNHMRSRRTRREFVSFVADLRNSPDVEIRDADAATFDAGLRLYANRSDKDWSLIDCTSFAIMHASGINEALTSDHHFEQAGFVALLK